MEVVGLLGSRSSERVKSCGQVFTVGLGHLDHLPPQLFCVLYLFVSSLVIS